VIIITKLNIFKNPFEVGKKREMELINEKDLSFYIDHQIPSP
jgi:hypothetical protein